MGLHLITLLPLTLQAQSTSTGILAVPHVMPYRGLMYSDFSSDSDIPVVGKEWQKRGRTFKGGDASTSSDDSSDFQEKKETTQTANQGLPPSEGVPISGCWAGPQGRLAWNIQVYHPSISGKLR